MSSQADEAPRGPKPKRAWGRGKFSRSKDDHDLMERLRQFEVVCRAVLQAQAPGATVGPGAVGARRLSLDKVGTDRFGLNHDHISYCIGRARFDLEEIRELERERNRRAMYNGEPRRAIVTKCGSFLFSRRKKENWQYLDSATSAELRFMCACAENAEKEAAAA